MADLSTVTPLSSALMGASQGINQGVNMAEKIQTMQNIPLQRQALEQHLATGALDLEAKKREEAILLAPRDYRKEPLYQMASPEHKATFDSIMNQVPEQIRFLNLGMKRGLEELNQNSKGFDALRDVSSRAMLGTLTKAREDYAASMVDPNAKAEDILAKKNLYNDLQLKYDDLQGKMDRGAGIVAVRENMRDPMMAPLYAKYPFMKMGAKLVESGLMDGKEYTKLLTTLASKDVPKFSAIQQYIDVNTPPGGFKTAAEYNQVFQRAFELTHPKTPKAEGAGDKFMNVDGTVINLRTGAEVYKSPTVKAAKQKQDAQAQIDFEDAVKKGAITDRNIEGWRKRMGDAGFNIEEVPGKPDTNKYWFSNATNKSYRLTQKSGPAATAAGGGVERPPGKTDEEIIADANDYLARNPGKRAEVLKHMKAWGVNYK